MPSSVRAAAAAYENSQGSSPTMPIVVQSRKRSVPCEPPPFLQQKAQNSENPLTSQIKGREAPWRKQRPVSIDLCESLGSLTEERPKLSITATSKVRQPAPTEAGEPGRTSTLPQLKQRADTEAGDPGRASTLPRLNQRGDTEAGEPGRATAQSRLNQRGDTEAGEPGRTTTQSRFKQRGDTEAGEPGRATTQSRLKQRADTVDSPRQEERRQKPVALPTKQVSMDVRDFSSESDGTVTPEVPSGSSDEEDVKFLKQKKGSLKKVASIDSPNTRRPSDTSHTLDLIRDKKQRLKKVDSVKSLKSPRLNKNKEIREVKENLKQAPSGQSLNTSPSFNKAFPGCPLPPPPPPPPPPPGFEKKPITPKRKEAIEKLRSRPRKRIDWSQMMKEIENGVSLKKVETSDRSQPLIPKCKSKGKFVYDSEKPNNHHQLLNEIQKGVRLKKVATNDRSKPILDGLRKFRRQLTVDEQQESVIPADPELDDIDKLRDDLQATKQLLMKEMRRREQAEHEKAMMEAELTKYKKELTNLLNQRSDLKSSVTDGLLEKLLLEKSASRKDISKSPSTLLTKCPSSLLKVNNKLERTETVSNFDEFDEFEVEYDNMKLSLSETEAEKKMLEKKQQDTLYELQSTKSQLEEALHKVLVMENKLEQNDIILMPEDLRKKPTVNICIEPISKSNQQQSINNNVNRTPLSQTRQDSKVILTHEDSATDSEDSSDMSEESEDEEDLDPKSLQLKRDIQFLEAKLKSTTERGNTARNEKGILTKQFRKLQDEMREAKRKYTKLKKELDNMLNMVDGKDESDADDESESTFSSEDEEDEEISAPDLKKLPLDIKKEQLAAYIKTLEEETTKNKKTNYLLKAKMDKLNQDLKIENTKHRELETELSTVLAELG